MHGGGTHDSLRKYFLPENNNKATKNCERWTWEAQS